MKSLYLTIPMSVFGEVEKRRKELRMSRSEFFARAAQQYIAEMDAKARRAARSAT
ncbi:ribbon-helix-helix protein, CopG family [Segniliparus rugosus]|uniref:Uncharacterized protein n=1 Tax=Segniliparus rugosus (strain ATCC BAA-974 / DSM 45345 / CCUG 50838 / CIP 108380 / JCM 13579 / CDC 945) TaxID=679197 RepID=E5XTY0_SEGRC|nr:ribbon-helix-helix protein, CopG family [Segniliparus rugosus]EFV12197.1 hypothetical protein HMPREF9336_02952 [Segniliparus rugosus ATCC BAA-974]